MPQLWDYWSTKSLYQNRIPTIISRNRFEGILGMFHVSDNEKDRPSDDQLYKMSEFLDMRQKKFKSSYMPEKDICIDESNVPFRGRIYFRQYIPNKRHRYGIKLFKLCVSGGYTWDFKVYTGREKSSEFAVSEKVVMELMEGLLDSGRTLYTDNWYTSVSLAKRLIDRKTHLVGTIRANRKGNPQEVIKEKLNRGGIVARQDNDKTVVLKWKDKRDVIMLSTKHDDSTVTLAKKGKEVIKPKVIVDYNQGKTFIDLSDQMSAYAPFLKRTSKWYKRLVFHLITAITIVNALHLYNKINKKKISITTFKEEVVSGLIENDEKLNTVSRPSTSKTQCCTLKEVEGQKRVTRKRCTKCYSTMSMAHNAAYARKNAKKVNSICVPCNIPLCITCFQKHLA
ncbi:piggyBac transposable element-derived protein 4-like [Anthonomus grandis grandis]|uniref:piggyBac transposable element-derived protein 4-like n=1 Tax=Anthonomus grandis grandis TaxID=2921223 RepID=UPI0021664A43|nr:piggyBac transposable element-derived protein 4-like [Anthonomus grandis grandis]